MNAIEIQHLRVGYGDKVLLQDLNFSIATGEVFVILGGSGCGKSSLLKNLFGLYQPLAGDVSARSLIWINDPIRKCTSLHGRVHPIKSPRDGFTGAL